MTVYINRGGGAFDTTAGPSVFVSGDYTHAPNDIARVMLADWNGDGLPDVHVATSNGANDTLPSVDLIYLNLGEGVFASQPLAGPATVVRVAPQLMPLDLARYKFGDFNGDSITDLLYAVDATSQG